MVEKPFPKKAIIVEDDRDFIELFIKLCGLLNIEVAGIFSQVKEAKALIPGLILKGATLLFIDEELNKSNRKSYEDSGQRVVDLVKGSEKLKHAKIIDISGGNALQGADMKVGKALKIDTLKKMLRKFYAGEYDQWL